MLYFFLGREGPGLIYFQALVRPCMIFQYSLFFKTTIPTLFLFSPVSGILLISVPLRISVDWKSFKAWPISHMFGLGNIKLLEKKKESCFLRDYYNEYNRVVIPADTSSKASRFFSVILEIVMEENVILEIVTEKP